MQVFLKFINPFNYNRRKLISYIANPNSTFKLAGPYKSRPCYTMLYYSCLLML